ncbi:unnamed protein product [Cladocopium goreaui]|uniref:Uncharacterized protein n=1 Tax=Cladocopium goreaui TaxID=2562237 RepID=A0A9P1FG17_9DINO|nr:unnamed protein product [Cladocopium goreaui]
MRRSFLEDALAAHISWPSWRASHEKFIFVQDLDIGKPAGLLARPRATCFESAAALRAAKEMQKTLDAEADQASRLSAAADEADRSARDPDDMARQEQHLPKGAIPSRKDCPEILCEKCPEHSFSKGWGDRGKGRGNGAFDFDLAVAPRCPACPVCPACPHGYKHPGAAPGQGSPPAALPEHRKIVCKDMDNNCPYCPACECLVCPKDCPPCIKRPPNDPPSVVLGDDGEPHSADGSPINPLVQAINDDVASNQ